ncbi:MAG: ribbon-helix-helix protein, CopG family [Gammaproteobacteria bacterium]|jgi:antitoxin ParD1/3/4|nr:ribbon-helix-helix protein, CopG family [Gammaproteobacteria bacterium]
MSQISISLPDDLEEFVREQVAASSYTSTSEYLRQLIREHREVVRFRNLIDEGASSPIEGTFDKPYFDDLRTRARSRTARK